MDTNFIDDLIKFFKRAYRMFTFQLLIFVVLIKLKPNLFPEWFIDIIRALCVLMAILVIYFTFAVYGYDKTMQSVYESFPSIQKNTSGMMFIHLINYIVHFLPVFIIGFPKNKKSYIYALIILLIWYMFNKKDMHKIYFLNSSK
jgi:hypothetical protein